MTPCQKLLKQEGTARCMQQSSATPINRDVGRGLRKIVACSQSFSQCLLVSTSFWHGVIPTSYFIFNDFYTCFTHFSQQCIGIGNDTVGKQRRSCMQPLYRRLRERALCAAPQCARWPASPARADILILGHAHSNGGV